ncbi:uncharacterized protein LOC112589714 [Harpegnathos saltator]|uniref:uncharacterized protein LOC112589714 n=1 Tax=Harpegnathos saltator TaxID=610380 RepID=UPI000DBEE054|nr:uncharacterized protein LOC112589714 [Harpegnathos saltator]
MYKTGLSSLRLYEGSVPSIFPHVSNLSITESIHCNENNNASSEVLMEDESTIGSHQGQIQDDMTYSTKTNTVASNDKCLIRYPGDITTEKVANMSSSSLRKYVTILRKKYNAQQIAMNRLRSQVYSQKKTIERLKQLFTALRKNNLISSNAEQVLQVIKTDTPSLHILESYCKTFYRLKYINGQNRYLKIQNAK